MQESQSGGPIFLVGSGRSGTTLLFNLLLAHPELAWISRLTDRFPAAPWLATLSRSGTLRRHRAFQPSTDTIRAYAHCGITDSLLLEKGASLTEHDATDEMAERLRRLAADHVRYMGRSRFINKSTMNTMRIRMIRAIFPDAYFVHIIRNGYAVVNSLVRVSWWPNANIWWQRTTPREWERNGGNPHELAAMNWKRQVEEILSNKDAIAPDRYMECRYEALLGETEHALEEITRFCDLRDDADFKRHVRRFGVSAGNRDKWQQQLDDGAKRIVSDVAGGLLSRLGYDVVSDTD